MSITHTIVKILFHEILHARRRKAVTEEIQARHALRDASKAPVQPMIVVVRPYGEPKTRWTADMRTSRQPKKPVLPKGFRALDC